MDGAGITGLRLFCSSLSDPGHSSSEKMMEFPGSFGSWGEKHSCTNGHWVSRFYHQYAMKETTSEHFGVVQIRISCTIKRGKDLGPGGNTEPADQWQHGLLDTNIGYSKPTVCQDFISGAKVQTDQNNASLSKPPEENGDMVGINNVKLACNIYGKFNPLPLPYP